MLTIIGAISALEVDLIRERILAGMRRAKLEGRRIGRAPLNIDRVLVVSDRRSGMSLTEVAKKYHISRGTVCRLVNEADRLHEPSASKLGDHETSVRLTETSLPAAA
jgi:DNA invertase Pin-like site-specific DNA recombinase